MPKYVYFVSYQVPTLGRIGDCEIFTEKRITQYDQVNQMRQAVASNHGVEAKAVVIYNFIFLGTVKSDA